MAGLVNWNDWIPAQSREGGKLWPVALWLARPK
jgi:hypothetical protein